MSEGDLFQFEWPVDQTGYALRHVESDGIQDERDEIYPLGGPPRFYRPLENPALWRQFAESCANNEGALAFVQEFGLLGLGIAPKTDTCDWIFNLARPLQLIAINLDHEDRETAAAVFRAHDLAPAFRAAIHRAGRRFEIRLRPMTLASALLLQAAEAITGHIKFRRCKNCPKWFHYGAGTGSTSRREFCSDSCRVLWNRHHKHDEVQK